MGLAPTLGSLRSSPIRSYVTIIFRVHLAGGEPPWEHV
jgi:hypothetical protein